MLHTSKKINASNTINLFVGATYTTLSVVLLFGLKKQN